VNRRVVGVGAVVAVAAVLVVFGAGGFVRVVHMKREIRALEQELTTLRARTEALGQTIECLRHDPLCIERTAREELGMVREGETILKFPSTAPR
jgi:cell division protein FtsB